MNIKRRKPLILLCFSISFVRTFAPSVANQKVRRIFWTEDTYFAE